MGRKKGEKMLDVRSVLRRDVLCASFCNYFSCSLTFRSLADVNASLNALSFVLLPNI